MAGQRLPLLFIAIQKTSSTLRTASHYLMRGAIPLQVKHREEQVGLSGVILFGQPLAILEGHALNAQRRVDETAN